MKAIQNYNLSEDEEKKIILREYRSLLRALKSKLKKGDKKIVRRAFEISVDAHKDMRRKSGEPYILHPLAVAKIVVEEISLGVTSVVCALLHDTVEDTEVTLSEIELVFGPLTAQIVEGLTKISTVVETKDTTQQAENFKKILLTLADDPRVILIKIADRLHNMRTLDSMSRDKQLKIASETSYLYAPLAHRLGLYEIKSELEDLALKFTEKEEYDNIVKKLKDTKRERTRYINEFIKPLKEELEKRGFQFEIYGRPKSVSSILNKIRTKHVTFEEIYDLFAIRIIVKSQENKKEDQISCWNVLTIINGMYEQNPERHRDWLKYPKSNGYEAIHATVRGADKKWVEIQIRSERMNEIAEKGIAAHWRYKDGNNKESKFDNWLKHISEILKNPDSNSLEFIQDIKSDILLDEIYVYTPNGDMRMLPVGSTALDFAFEIHSEIGKNSIGAKVNFKLVPLSHILQNGDQIEIITSKKQIPQEEWLKIVKTVKAKSRIKNYIKEEKRIISEPGKKLLEKKLESLHIPITQNVLNDISSHFSFQSPLYLHYAITMKSFDLSMLNSLRYQNDKLILPYKKPLETETPPSIESDIKKDILSKGYELVLFGENSDKIQYKLGSCCQPIPGDDVFGFVTSGEGLKIHRTNCPNATSLLSQYGHRVVKAKWGKNSKRVSLLSGVKINGIDDVGVINKITNVVSGELKMNMRSMSIDSSDGLFEGTIMVFVTHKMELDTLCERLEALDGINKVTRLDATVND